MAKTTAPKRIRRKKEKEAVEAAKVQIAEIVDEGVPEGAREGKLSFPKGSVPPAEARLLVNRFVHRMTLAGAAEASGILPEDATPKALERKASKVIRKHKDANSSFVQALEAKGLGPDHIVTKIAEGLDAKSHVKVKDAAGNEELVEVPDFNARHKYIETALDIHGAKASKKVEVTNLTFEQRLLRITMGQDDGGGE